MIEPQVQDKPGSYKKSNNLSREEKILLSAPKPLFSKEYKLAMFWSAKSGCTFAIKWFFYQIGSLEAALDYDPWIHKFRQEVIQSSEEYQKYISQILNPETNIIRLVRNPYSRAVSSYIHALRYGYEDEQISQFLVRPVNEQKRFSFREFVAYLRNIDLWHCNIHHKIQMHESEKKNLIKPNYIVKLENSFDEIPKIEKTLGLLHSDLKSFARSVHHTAKNSDSSNVFCADECFDIYKKRMRALPPTICFFDSTLKKEVANLYQVDFETYEYDVDLIT